MECKICDKIADVQLPTPKLRAVQNGAHLTILKHANTSFQLDPSSNYCYDFHVVIKIVLDQIILSNYVTYNHKNAHEIISN